MTPILIRVEPEALAAIDEARGLVSRAEWVRRACDSALGPASAVVEEGEPVLMPLADPVVSEMVGEAPVHRHRRVLVETRMVEGVQIRVWRCGVCGVALG